MTEESDAIDIGAIPKHAPIWLTMYATILGILYQSTFWSRFDIGITQYLGLQDLIRISLIPLLIGTSSLSIFVGGYLIAMESWFGTVELTRDPVAPGGRCCAKPLK